MKLDVFEHEIVSCIKMKTFKMRY